MKKFILICTVMLFTASSSYSQCGLAITSGIPTGRTLANFFYPCTGQTFDVYAGVIAATLEGVPNIPFYCLDLCTGIGIPDTVADSAASVSPVIYILQNYYPQQTSYTGKLPNNNDEAAAVQCAIWNIRNGLDITTSVVNVTVRDRAIVIAADAIANGGSSSIVTTFSIHPGINFDEFVVRTFDQNGNGIAISNIQLTITSGSLSTNLTSTNASGESPPIVVSGTNAGIITATGNVVTPSGLAFSGYTTNLQVLGLALTTTASRCVTADWGLLPVELSSFTANVMNSNVNLNWNTASETNNSGFDLERKSVSSGEWQKVGFVEGHGTTNVPYDFFYMDRNVASGRYNYRLKQIDFNGNFEYHNLNSEIEVGTPAKFNLSQNYPNPFNPETKINYELPSEGHVSLKVFDNSGKEVATLVNQVRVAGYHTANFNASGLSSGVYFYRLEANGFMKVMKMALVK